MAMSFPVPANFNNSARARPFSPAIIPTPATPPFPRVPSNLETEESADRSAPVRSSIIPLWPSTTPIRLLFWASFPAPGTFAQIGTGTTLLIANNTYTGNTTISAGTLQLGNGNTTGSVAGAITDNANLTFDRSDNVTYSNVISGTGNVTKLGPNTLTITQNQTYTGVTNVNEGVLAVDGTLQSSSVLVNAGATLAGNGNVGCQHTTITISDGGHISPGTLTTAGTLTTNSLILSPLSQLDFQLGTANVAGAHNPSNDLLEVNGNLTLDGQLNITGTFGGDGTYRLIDYTGALTDNGLTLGILPGSSVPSNFIVQTAIPGEVNLIVQTSGTGTQFWDGANTTPNGAIDGGSGTWNNSAANTNWTIADGTANAPWNSGFAVFDATPGTVTVDSSSGPVSATGLQFAVDGYTRAGSFHHPQRRSAGDRSG